MIIAQQMASSRSAITGNLREKDRRTESKQQIEQENELGPATRKQKSPRDIRKRRGDGCQCFVRASLSIFVQQLTNTRQSPVFIINRKQFNYRSMTSSSSSLLNLPLAPFCVFHPFPERSSLFPFFFRFFSALFASGYSITTDAIDSSLSTLLLPGDVSRGWMNNQEIEVEATCTVIKTYCLFETSIPTKNIHVQLHHLCATNKFVINLPNNLYIIEIEKERDIESFVDHSILQSP